jgi:tetratricopeptide (TPR) repeat protein
MKSMAREAELYRAQGLLEESKEKYLKILQVIEKSQQFQHNEKAIDNIKYKIHSIEKDMAEIDQEAEVPELSGKIQDLIKKLFSFSQDKDIAEMEGAVALAIFGQYERALAEFGRLLREGTTPLIAAKNILRCHLALSSTDTAINQYQEWLSGELLSKEQLINIRSFLEYVLKKKGVQTELPEVVGGSSQESEDMGSEPDLLDISSIRLRLENGPRKGDIKEYDVTFQSGNVISLIISDSEDDLADSITPGLRLRGIQYFSPAAVFTGSGVVSECKRIKTGPRRGDFVLSIKISNK